MAMNRSLLFNFLKDSLEEYSESFEILDRKNPVQILLNDTEYSVHILHIHDSGNNRPNEDELRIQVRRNAIDLQESRQKAGQRVVFVGFFGAGDVFVAWDPSYVFSLRAKYTGSVYARESQAQEALETSASIHTFKPKYLGRNSHAVAMPVSAMGVYLENISTFHDLSDVEDVRKILVRAKPALADSGRGEKGEATVIVNGRREKITYERRSYPRDPKFTRSILRAYNSTCVVCQRQLGLTQAAHIIPHSDPAGENTVQNGLALCVEHHRLYDDALLLPGPKGRLVFNAKRAKFLEEAGRGAGLKAVRALHGKAYARPQDPAHEPNKAFLAKGLKIRMGGG